MRAGFLRYVRSSAITSRFAALAIAVLAIPAGVAAFAAAAPAATFVNWPGYLMGPAHSSASTAAVAITPATAPDLIHAWKWVPAAATMAGQPGKTLFASPTIVDGSVYIGANTGVFYALNEATGQVLWQRFLGFVTQKTCGKRGITSTATVAPDPVSGLPTVYVAGGDGHLYALDAATGAIVWRSVIGLPSATVNDYYDWSSPAVVNGSIYIGVSSQCDKPLVKGGLNEYSQATGAPLATYLTNPGGKIGPSIWSSPAVTASGSSVFVTTGNGPAGSDAFSVVRLDPATLTKLDSWQIPASQLGKDSDFGGSPTLFSATLNNTTVPMIGACNKNGTYYALLQDNLAAGPVWSNNVGTPDSSSGQCDAAAVWDGARLYVASNQTVIGGVTYAGSIRELDPATGSVIWARGLPGAVIGSPTLDGGGVLAVPTFSSSGTFLVDAATGAVLRNFTTGPEFGQPVFADNMLFVPSQNSGLSAYK
jgi:polyvinyl alcohol dehydrogenase (cytochrome)